MSLTQWKETASEAWEKHPKWNYTHTAQWALILLVLISSLSWLDGSIVRNLANNAADYLTHGGSTWILEASDQISGTACDALAQADGVISAGAIRDDHANLTTTTLPKGPIPMYSVTPGFLKVISSSSIEGISVSQQVASRYGLEPFSVLATKAGDITVTGIYPYPDDGRKSNLGFAALQPTMQDQAFDECWIDAWPSTENTALLTYTSLLSSVKSDQQEQPKLSQLNPRYSSSLDGQAQFRSRITRWTPLAAAVIGFTIGFFASWSRKLEHASALHAGIARSFLIAQMVQETLSWILMAAILSLPVIAISVSGVTQDTSHIALLALRPVIAGSAGAFAGSVVAILRIREKYLFTYFKAR